MEPPQNWRQNFFLFIQWRFDMVKFEKCFELGIVSKIAMIESNRKYCDQNYIESSKREYIFKPLCKFNLCFFHNSRVSNQKILESIRNILNACDTWHSLPRCRAWSPAKKVWCCNEKKKGANFARGNFFGERKGSKKNWPVLYLSGQIIATSHEFSPQNGGLFQGNLVWWNIIIWPDLWVIIPKHP